MWSRRNGTGEHSKLASTTSIFTKEGLPLENTRGFTALVTTTKFGNTPTRHIEHRSSELISTPSIFPREKPLLDSYRPILLKVGPVESSLIDDEDEVLDYFKSNSESTSITTPAVTTDSASSGSRWIVREHDVPTLPLFYPLEKSAVFVPQASAPILSTRIATVLQARSIVASYYSQYAMADCVSKYHVEFRIRLYRGRGEYEHGIIVEVQRRWGFDLSYAQDVQLILDAAEGKNIKNGVGLNNHMYQEEIEDENDADEKDMVLVRAAPLYASFQITSFDILCPQAQINPRAA